MSDRKYIDLNFAGGMVEALMHRIKEVENTLSNKVDKEKQAIPAYQQLVTGADGVQKWVDRTHYSGYEPIFENIAIVTRVDDTVGGLCAANIPMFQPASVGQIVKVVFDGQAYECAVSDVGAIGNMHIADEYMADTGEPFIIIPLAGMIVTAAEISAAVSIYTYQERMLDSKYLGSEIPRYGAVGNLMRIEWDGNTEGLESIVSNGFTYYKVSDFNIPIECVTTCESSRANIAEVKYQTYSGTNCWATDSALVVTSVGKCVNEVGHTFTANSTGTYFMKHQFTTGLDWCAYLEVNCQRENSALYLVNPLGVTYAITVDNSGTLTATAVT